MRFKVWQSQNPDSWFSCNPGKNGFFPNDKPLDKLPIKYDIINKILDEIKVYFSKTKSENELYPWESKLKELPIFDFSDIKSKQLLAALQRDYCFLASAYSLETTHNKTGSENKDYGIARDYLPKQLAIPLIQLSKLNDTLPWLDYAFGYGLNNAILKENSDPTNYKSYETIRTFTGIDSESGFINVHVAMVAQSGNLLKYQQKCLLYLSKNKREKFNKSLQKHYEILKSIIDTLQTMWKACKYNEYLFFRTFIMGQKGNKKCYPNESINYNLENNIIEKHSYRGETGAQDSIIPSVDSFLQLKYPKNKLTEYLYDLRKYRPKDHQLYINFMKDNSEMLKIKEYCMKNTESSIILLKNLNCLRMFRKKHWNLTKKYIIQNTKHPTATGGTPITTWLPNQLGATLEYMDFVLNNIKKKNIKKKDIEFYDTIKLELSDHIQTLMDEVSSMQEKFNEQIHNEFLNRS